MGTIWDQQTGRRLRWLWPWILIWLVSLAAAISLALLLVSLAMVTPDIPND